MVTGFAGGETGNTMLLNETLAWRFTPSAVHVLNTVGSGDATTAGIAAGLVRGQSMPDAVQLGIACGSANAMTLTPGDLDADLVKKLVPEVAGVVGRGQWSLWIVVNV